MTLNLPAPSCEPSEIAALESSLTLPHFTCDDAWKLGTYLRSRLLSAERPAVVNITLANSNQLLFHAVAKSGTIPDNDIWVSRKRKVVLRWGCSSWYMRMKMAGDEERFAKTFMLGDSAGSYGIYGGGVPIRVKGTEGVVAVVVVSGLKQEDDHAIVIEGLQELLKSMTTES